MSIDKAREYLRQLGMEDRIHEFDVSSATVELAAQAIGCEPALIAKTLSFLVDGHAILVVAAGDARIDNQRFKARFHSKARMLLPEQVETMVGHAVGGVCPFGVNEGVDIYLDESLRRFTTVYPACGSDNSMVALTIPELERCSGFPEWVDVCKDWREG